MTAPTDLGHRATVPLAPGAWPVIGHAWPLLRDPLAFLASLPAHGGLVQVRLGGLAAVVVCDPGLTREVLLDDRTYDKGGPIYDGLRELVGDGIASSPHCAHRRQRRLIQPAFHPGRIPGYAETMAARIAAATGRWHEGQVLDVVPELLAITMQTTVETMFSGVLTPQGLREAVEDFTTVVVGIFRRMLLPPLLNRLPTPGNHRYHQARSRLRRTVGAVLCDRRAEPRGTDHGDLLSALLAEDPADGGLSDTEVSDQILTFFAAGAETTAATVSWALHLLSGHPCLRDQVYAEVDTVLAGAPVSPQHLPRLELTGRVVIEAVRLYPPGWLLTRTVTADTTLGGHILPAGTTIIYSPYLIHHRADLFTAPDSFIPDRWAPGAHRPQRDAFVAFGGGARKCPGEQFGLTEATLALACITAAWHLEPAPGRPVRPAAAAALKPHGLMMRATAHTSTTADAEQGAR
jgi:cytochrome P450